MIDRRFNPVRLSPREEDPRGHGLTPAVIGSRKREPERTQPEHVRPAKRNTLWLRIPLARSLALYLILTIIVRPVFPAYAAEGGVLADAPQVVAAIEAPAPAATAEEVAPPPPESTSVEPIPEATENVSSGEVAQESEAQTVATSPEAVFEESAQDGEVAGSDAAEASTPEPTEVALENTTNTSDQEETAALTEEGNAPDSPVISEGTPENTPSPVADAEGVVTAPVEEGVAEDGAGTLIEHATEETPSGAQAAAEPATENTTENTSVNTPTDTPAAPTHGLDTAPVAPEAPAFAAAEVPAEEVVAQEGATSEPVESEPLRTPDEIPPPVEPEPLPSATTSVAATADERDRAELRREIEREIMSACISYDEGGYYCVKEGATAPGAAPANRSISIDAEQDPGGDKEIFLTRNGVRTALTDNDWDDIFPSEDISGERFVWQGQKNGRWQIFWADVSDPVSPVVRQVTDARDGNFNPKISGDRIVWQGWVADNWEIFLATKRDAASPFASEHLPEANALLGVGVDWSVERLTRNTAHDMFPSIHGEVITWQTREGDGWSVYAYSISERAQTKLSSDGTKSENPRFAITWEERDSEGRVRLMSYDIGTGKKVDLTSEARGLPDRKEERLPIEIPNENQATLPAGAATGTSTPSKGNDESLGGDPNTDSI